MKVKYMQVMYNRK